MSDCACTVCEELRQLAERRSGLLYPPLRGAGSYLPEARAAQVAVINRHILRLEELGCQQEQLDLLAPQAEPVVGCVSGAAGSAGGAATAAEGHPPNAPPPAVH